MNTNQFLRKIILCRFIIYIYMDSIFIDNNFDYILYFIFILWIAYDIYNKNYNEAIIFSLILILGLGYNYYK